mmetsp:Transcript_50298/g.90388  ORF Transcript_50298/g.90388 Transcript_50298/m.90388 type:complete len:217 (-) Transcript_50298:1053-1703(-)
MNRHRPQQPQSAANERNAIILLFNSCGLVTCQSHLCHNSVLLGVLPNHPVRLPLPCLRVLPHLREAHGNVHGLFRANPNTFLDVWHSVRFTDLLERGLTLLVGQHGQIRPAVVLDLVVQPTVHEVVHVATCGKVGGGCDCPEVESGRLRLARGAELVQVVAGVIWDYHDEAVKVGEHVRQEEVAHSIPVEGRVDEGKGQGKKEEVPQKVRTKHLEE